ncbi:universal stress protein, partial [Streptomyces anulatus]|uniref:universal stress protein n=1 Tax=Streptomyces anulatus TaxID=1892 RepID=UPI0036916C16
MRQRIVVGVSGSPGSLAALHRAAAEARERNAELYAVLAWQLPGGGLGGRATYGAALLRECREAAVEDLRTLLDGAFAVRRPGVALSGLAGRGAPGAVLGEAAGSAHRHQGVGTGAPRTWQ